MKRKVAKLGTVRLSPNEEDLLLKQERERRRKLRLKQVREQEKFIAQQIRNNVKERREQELQHLAEELRSEWQASQAEKLRALEKLYMSSLSAIGEGHRQAKENEPDLQAIEKKMAANKQKAEKRHREALKELKQHKEKQLRDQTWLLKARKKALSIEKDRAAKIASLPPPPPDPLENLEGLRSLPTVKLCNVDAFSASYYHLSEPYVDREADTEQPDARVAAEDEAKRLDGLEREAERERREQLEKAQLRGSHALKMVHLSHDRDKLLKELEQMQQVDLAERRRIVAQMPQQLFEPAYRRAEIQEEWQRELESAFEDMYTGERRVKGDMVLNLKPQPLPVPAADSFDDDLDLSVDPEHVDGPRCSVSTEEETHADKPPDECNQPHSRVIFKRLLSKIRTQQDQWSAKSEAETQSDTLESGSLPTEKQYLDAKANGEHDEASQPVTDEVQDMGDSTIVAGNAVSRQPLAPALPVGEAPVRNQQLEDLERQKQEQLNLLIKLEEEKKRLEAEYLRVQMQESKKEEPSTLNKEKDLVPMNTVAEPVETPHEEPKPANAPALSLNNSTDSPHIQIIRDYQQRLIQQNRVHKESVEAARKRLEEYQQLLRKRYSHVASSGLGPATESQRTATVKPCDEQNQTMPLQQPPCTREIGWRASTLSSIEETIKSSELSTMPNSGQAFLPGIEKRMENKITDLRQVGPIALSHSKEPIVGFQSSLLGNVRKEQGNVIDENVNVLNLTNRITTLQNGSEGSTQTVKDYPAPEGGEIGPRESPINPEKQSSVSSNGDFDTASDSFYSLPSSLSLGLPQAVTLITGTDERLLPNGHVKDTDGFSLGEFSNVQEFQKGLISSTAKMQAQQAQLREMQLQLDKQKEVLLSKQKVQEDRLLLKQKELEYQMRKHQESLEQYLANRESGQGSLPPDICHIPKTERLELMSAMLKALGENKQDDLGHGYGFGPRAAGREQRGRPSKPPVSKTKLGPLLEQHELSAILEVETPSTELKKMDLGRQDTDKETKSGLPASFILENTRKACDDSQKEFGLSKTSSFKDQSSNESLNTSYGSKAKLSWREMLSLGSASVGDQRHPDQRYLLQSGLSSLPSGSETGIHFDTLTQESSQWLGAKGLVKLNTECSPKAQTVDSSNDLLSTTTISTGSFMTSEKADSSSNSECLSDLQKCNYSLIKEAKNTSWSSALNVTPGPNHDTTYNGSALDQRSHIQQIIDKYTKELSDSLERNLSFHTPTAALDISGTNDHHGTPPYLYALDPRPDLSLSTASDSQFSNTEMSQETKNTSQSSVSSNGKERLSNKSPRFQLPGCSQSISSSFKVSNVPNLEANQTVGSSESFHPLNPECTNNELILSNSQSSLSNGSPIDPEVSSNTNKQQTSSSSSGSSSKWKTEFSPYMLQSSVDTLRAQSYSLVDTLGSFHELMATQITMNDTALSEHQITNLLKIINDGAHTFEELPVSQEDRAHVDRTTTTGCQQDTIGNPLLHTSADAGIALMSPPIMKPDTSADYRTNHNSFSFISSSACSLPSSVPIWGTGSAHGIMEEPELTQLSFPDSSFAGSEHITTQNIASDHNMEPSNSESGFHPLQAEVDQSQFSTLDWTEKSSSWPHSVVELDSVCPETLQEAFLKKKKHFIANSARRREQVKQKVKEAKLNSQANGKFNLQGYKTLCPEEAPLKTDASQLKKVLEVRVLTPEERKLSEIEMHQRTIRLYNQLDEVKNRKEEQFRKEHYARNREKAKEFKKKTLEKLRSRTMK
ncbi:hypothetical protein GDO86_004735 [Hymenochirus boettgeri]|uniref:ALMS motif domain-containing protein n=1 Tax=Hymenochirus boettgeri TaxID=247094 RepID=A0A8T2KBQ5_9PIPI|nr:hypothetical protein GDO86_004735 [Hymenochirus boettgeri]